MNSDAKITTAIADMGEKDGDPYPRAIWDDPLRCWPLTSSRRGRIPRAFTSKKGQAIIARLIVRRARDLARPKLRPVRQVIWGLTWGFAALAGSCSGYFMVSGIGTPMSSKASRWVLVGSASIGMATWVPAKRTWLRVKVARCSSRPRKLW